MKKIIYLLLLFLVSCSPYKKIPNISTPTYRQINKAMKNSEPYQQKRSKNDIPSPRVK